jgi:hypothetical protein
VTSASGRPLSARGLALAACRAMPPAAFFAVRDVGFHGGWRGLRQQDDSAAHHGEGGRRDGQHGTAGGEVLAEVISKGKNQASSPALMKVNGPTRSF